MSGREGIGTLGWARGIAREIKRQREGYRQEEKETHTDKNIPDTSYAERNRHRHADKQKRNRTKRQAGRDREKRERGGEIRCCFFICRLLLLVPLSSFSCLKTTGFLTPGMYYTRTSSCATESTFISSLFSLTSLALALIGVNITRQRLAFVCVVLSFFRLSCVFFVFIPSRMPHPFPLSTPRTGSYSSPVISFVPPDFVLPCSFTQTKKGPAATQLRRPQVHERFGDAARGVQHSSDGAYKRGNSAGTKNENPR